MHETEKEAGVREEAWEGGGFLFFHNRLLVLTLLLQVSGGVIGFGIQTADWSSVYMGYFTVRVSEPSCEFCRGR
jgi:hypothetical protein